MKRVIAGWALAVVAALAVAQAAASAAVATLHDLEAQRDERAAEAAL